MVNEDKFKNLILYILGEAGPLDDAALCWRLWWCDCESYFETGESITGAAYVKGEHGYPEPCNIGE